MRILTGTLATILYIILSHISVNAQKVQLSGTLIDTAGFAYMEHASVTLIRAEDSMLYDFTRADSNGRFSMEVDGNKEYNIMISHPDFATRNERLSVSDKDLNLGQVIMLTKVFLLQEVIVKGDRAIVIKGDTTEYAADSFKVREFDNVDALLKRLPGIEVDAKGNITAHGEKVQKMLVDGDEFFGDDPAVLSKMLRASAVDKVQVFDKKSETAEITGIDDGERIKTINLKLKDNAKNGYFGKVEAGGGLPAYWENQAMINAFKGKRKIAAYGVMSNTNKVGLGWDDANKYSNADDNMFVTEDGFTIQTRSDDDMNSFGGQYSGEGLPKSWNAGLYYGNKFGKQQQHNWVSDYRFNKNDLYATSFTKNQYILPDTQYVNNVDNIRSSSRLNHNLYAKANIKVDSLSDIIITAKGRMGSSTSSSRRLTNYEDVKGNKINESNTNLLSEGMNQSFNTNATYRKRFLKQGRSLTGTVGYNNNENKNDGLFTAVNSFVNVGTTTFDQRKEDHIRTSKLNTEVTYSEPLIAEKLFLTTRYEFSNNVNDNANLTYDRIGNTDTLNKTFSSHYKLSVLTHTGGMDVRYNGKKIQSSLGGSLGHTSFQQYNYFLDSTRNRTFINLFPRAELTFSENRSKRISLRYNGSTRQPDINQLQPLVVNTDPTNIMVGNPNLTQEFNHSLSLNFNLFQILSQRYFYGSISGSYIHNAISQVQKISPLGVREFSYANLDGNMNLTSWLGASHTLVKNLRMSYGLNAGLSRNNTILNEIPTLATNYNLGYNINANYDKDTNYSLSYYFNHSYNNTRNSNRTDIKTSFNQFTNQLEGYYNFPKGWTLGTDVSWIYREKIYPTDNNNSLILWNSYISKSFLKDRSLVLKLTGNDILNNNIGFRRMVTDNNITETKYNNIRRYFMLSVTWNFTKSNAVSDEPAAASTEVEAASTDPDDY